MQLNTQYNTMRYNAIPYHTIHAYIDTCLRSWGDNLRSDRATWDQRNERAKDASATSSDAPLDHHGDSKLVASRKSNGATRTLSIHMWYCISMYIVHIVYSWQAHSANDIYIYYIKYVYIYIHIHAWHTHMRMYMYTVYMYACNMYTCIHR